ncbi:MAG: hypothetical protein Q9191_005341 [Dirinaria sp. TL-2023a]
MVPPSPTNVSPKRGTYIPSKPTDIRSPCPAVNALANHGYIARDGRNIRASELHAALGELGLGSFMSTVFTYPPFIELPTDPQPSPPSWWDMISSPFAHALGGFAMRRPGQTDADGVAVLDLDQLARPNVVEHDVSLSRRDFAQGDNIRRQPDLISNLLAASSNGEKITLIDFVKLRKDRLAEQRRVNPKLHFQAWQNQLACAEVALILKVLGDGSEVPVDYVKAFFQEERLPREEGWKKRVWWSLGLVELNVLASKVKGLVGDFGGKEGPVVAAVH